jgi:outer membrane protein assembly factor BamB
VYALLALGVYNTSSPTFLAAFNATTGAPLWDPNPVRTSFRGSSGPPVCAETHAGRLVYATGHGAGAGSAFDVFDASSGKKVSASNFTAGFGIAWMQLIGMLSCSC